MGVEFYRQHVLGSGWLSSPSLYVVVLSYQSRCLMLRLPMVGFSLAVLLWVAACASPTAIISNPEPVSGPAETTVSEIQLSKIPFTIQAGAFTTTARAARYCLRLQQLGVDAYYFMDTDGLFKVRIERFEDKKTARRRAMELQALGRIDDFFIIQPVPRGRQIDSRSSLQRKIAQTAHRFIGTSYRWGGDSARGGFDCSGLSMTVYRLNGLALPRNSRSQFKAGKPIVKKALQKGDLVFFATNGGGRISHVGIYTGQGQFIHAPGRGKRIRISSLSNGYFKARYMGARRYF
jgi:hypothetical protein